MRKIVTSTFGLIQSLSEWAKKLFAEGTQPERFKSVYGKVTDTGVLFATYEPTGPLKKTVK